MIDYSWRSMPGSADDILNYCIEAGVSYIEMGGGLIENFAGANQWQKWYDANKERIYFSDVGGYKFRVVPEGYLD